MRPFKIHETVIHHYGSRVLKVKVTGYQSDIMFRGTVLESTDTAYWPIGLKDTWVIDRFERIVDIDEEFNKALDNLEACYGKI